MANDLAGSSVYGPINGEQLYAGEAPIISGRAVSLAAITKYQLIALTTTGVTPFVVGTHTAGQMRIAAQPASASGVDVPYFEEGYFNPAIIGWPASLNTLALQKAALSGSRLSVERILPV